MKDDAVNAAIRGVVCLSTPFVAVTARTLGTASRFGMLWAPGILIYLTLEDWRINAAWWPAGFGSDKLFAFVCAAGVALAFRASVFKLARSVERLTQLPKVEPRKLLILRVVGDEALIALSTLHAVTKIIDAIWRASFSVIESGKRVIEEWRAALTRSWSSLVSQTAMLTAAIGLVWFLLILPLPEAQVLMSGQERWTSLMPLVFSGVLLLSILLRGWPGSLFVFEIMLGYFLAYLLIPAVVVGALASPELGLAALALHVSTEATPVGEWVVHQLDPDSNSEEASLAHGQSYDTSRALAVIDNWLQTNVSALIER
jgi:hypothetical protein